MQRDSPYTERSVDLERSDYASAAVRPARRRCRTIALPCAVGVAFVLLLFGTTTEAAEPAINEGPGAALTIPAPSAHVLYPSASPRQRLSLKTSSDAVTLVTANVDDGDDAGQPPPACVLRRSGGVEPSARFERIVDLSVSAHRLLLSPSLLPRAPPASR